MIRVLCEEQIDPKLSKEFKIGFFQLRLGVSVLNPAPFNCKTLSYDLFCNVDRSGKPEGRIQAGHQACFHRQGELSG